MAVRTRFAPSPTGYLHVGGARTALFAYLYARRHGGQFVLRVEDTDRERSTEASVQAILDGMAWLGLDYDEGPVFQTDRFDRYREVLDGMLEAGTAYYCYCTPERLTQVREARKAEGLTGYDGHCRDVTEPPPGAPAPVIRFRNPLDGEVRFKDAVKGEIVKENRVLNDFVMARSDGTPTYNFAVVVDDMDMGITHVIRGDDHLDNTSSQINVYRALGAEPPAFAHVPMILGHDGQRLSKRHGAVSVMQYRDEGYLPHALLNYLVRLGWSHGDQEVFTADEMRELFDLSGANRAPSTFNPEKLVWINQHWLQHGEASEVEAEMAWHFERLSIDTSGGPSLAAVRALLCERATTVADLAEQARFLFEEFEAYDEKAAKKTFRPVAEAPLAATRAALADQDDWSAEALAVLLQQVVDKLGVGFGKVGQPLRLALTGRPAAPANDAVLAALGRERSLARIDRALAVIAARREAPA